MTIGKSLLATIAIVVIAATAPARAQSVDAEALFRDGKRLMKEGNVAAACDKFDASNRLETSVGTMLNLADCREKNHQLATAWATFLKAAAAAKQAGNDPKREAEAKRRAKVLEAKLAYLTINVADANRVDGLVIKRNGNVVDPALWNTGTPVDAGTYEISGSAPGLDPWTTKTDVTDGQQAKVDVPKLEKHAAVVKTPVVTNTIETHTDEISEPPPEEPVDTGPSSFTGMRKAAVAAAVIGVAGIVVGGVFGSKANDLEKQADAICPNDACGDTHALDLNKDARSDATIANIGFIGGGVAVAGAAALWFLGAPKTTEGVSIAPSVRGDQVVVTIGGSF